MKWGIRRTPEQLGYKVRRQAKDLTAKTIPAGTKCFRIATKDDPGVARGKDTYIAYLPVDRANIRSIAPWLMSVRGKALSEAYEREYEITKDIKVASYEEVAAIRREMMASPEYRKEAATNMAVNRLRNNDYEMDEINLIQSIATGKTSLDTYAEQRYAEVLSQWKQLGKTNEEFKRWADKMENDKPGELKTIAANMERSVEIYKQNEARTNEVLAKMGSRSIKSITDGERRLANMAMDMVYGLNGINKAALQSELKKRGYDAMYDNAMISVNSLNSQEAYEPLILFDGGSALKETGGKYLTSQEIGKAQVDFYDWRSGVEKDAAKKRIQT